MKDPERAERMMKRKNQRRTRDIFKIICLLCGSARIVGSAFLLGDFVSAGDEINDIGEGAKAENTEAEMEEKITKKQEKDITEEKGGSFGEEEKSSEKKATAVEKNEIVANSELAQQKAKEENEQINGKVQLMIEQVLVQKQVEKLSEDESSKNENNAKETNDEKIRKGDIVINEVMLGQEGFTKNEFVELYNATDENIDLEGWNLKKMTKSGTKSNLLSKSKFRGIIKKGGYFVIAHPNYKSISVVDAIYSGSSYSISKNNAVVLLDDDQREIAALCWGICGYECPGEKYDDNSRDGMSISRTSEENNSYAVSRIPTPGEQNQFPPKEKYSKLIIFNEVLPNPQGTDKNNEWVEFKNLDSEEIDLSGWIIENGSGKRLTIKRAISSSDKLLVVSVENTSLSVRNNNEQLLLLDPNEEIVDRVVINGYAKSGLSYNRTSQGTWKWSRFLTPGEKNRMNNPPKIRITKSKKIYKDIYAEFDASKTNDKDKDKLKFRWDFGDGHKSYLKETRHKYDKKGKYKVVLTVDDGSEKVEKLFRIEVRSYPRREFKITKLIPNPSGKDRGNEIIVIRNLYKKRANLKGFKIATGRNKSHLVNHPIYDDFIIRSGKEKKIMNKEICKFTLLNKKGVVVLKYPDGKIADVVSYEKEKIANDEEYVLIFDQWKWIGGEGMNVQDGTSGISSSLEVVQDYLIEKPEMFDFLLITKNETEKICECLGKIKIENWKNKNKNWLEVLNFKKMNILTKVQKIYTVCN